MDGGNNFIVTVERDGHPTISLGLHTDAKQKGEDIEDAVRHVVSSNWGSTESVPRVTLAMATDEALVLRDNDDISRVENELLRRRKRL